MRIDEVTIARYFDIKDLTKDELEIITNALRSQYPGLTFTADFQRCLADIKNISTAPTRSHYRAQA